MKYQTTRTAFSVKLGDVTQYQYFDVGISRIEYFALHLMCASVTANDNSNPNWMTEELAEKHAKSAMMLAKALDNILNKEK